MNERLNAIVGAKISEFRKKMAEVREIASQFARNDATKDINADISDFQSDLNEAKAKIATFTSTDASKGLDLNAAKFTRKITTAQARATTFSASDAVKKINADTSDFNRGVTAAQARARNFRPKTIWVNIKVRHKQFQKDMDRIADAFRDFNLIGAEMGKGVMLTMIPVLATVLAGLTGVAATSGVALGVMAGGALALASSLSLALAGAIGFGAAMVPLIFDIKAARDAILSGEKALEDFSKPMQHAQLGLIAMKATFKNLTNAIEPYALQAMGTAMYIVSDAMTFAKPGIVAVSQAVQGLMDDLRNVIKTAPDVQASFAWFNERAASAVENWAKIAGYAFQGFINLMRAFDPLAISVEQGLLNMTKRFSEWSAGLSKSDKFQKFIEYVKINGPKLLDIFGDIVVGIVNMFVAFAPLAADMLTGFQKMTQKFREWSAALGENKQFQAFVQYIRDNAPQIRQLIKNIVLVGVELVKALGRIGETLLPVINGFLSWLGQMLKANPAIAGIIAGTFSMMGAFKLLAPIIATFRLMFGGAIKYIWGIFNPFKINIKTGMKMIGSAAKTAGSVYKSVFIKMGDVIWKAASAIGNWLRMLVTTFISTTAEMIKALGKMIAKAAVWAGRMILHMAKVAGKYAWLGIKALFHAGKVAASWLIAMGPVGWVIATVVALVALIIANWDKVKKWTKQIWSAVSNWISEKWNQIVSFTKTAAQLVWQWVKEKFNSAKDAISNAMNNAWSFIKNIWGNIKSFISNTASSIWSTVKGKFGDIVSAIQEKMNSAWDKIESIWGNIQDFFSNIDLFDIGADIIRGLINGIGSMAASLWEKARSIASGIGDAIKGALGIKSPSRVTMELGMYTGQGLYKGMENTISRIKRASNELAYAAVPNIPGLSPVTPSLASLDSPSYSGGSMDGLMRSGTTNNDNSSQVNNYYVTVPAKDIKEFKEVTDFFVSFEQTAKQM